MIVELLFVLVIFELLLFVSNCHTNLNYIVARRIVIKLLVTYFQRNHSKEVCIAGSFYALWN